ncbi:glycosyltransferase family 4 protein [Patescibacteria group bacterium]|nr:glycosyltransferase family 4 protein [Patescibacteria group bacterium]
MKILMVSSFLPFPLTSGGHIRLYNLIKNLSEKHSITLICEKRDNQTEEDLAQVENICEKVITVRRKKQWSIENILKTGFSSNPFLITGHTSEEMRLLIQDELVKMPYDLIHVETFYVYQNLPKVRIPVVLVEHNIEYLVYQRYAKLANPVLKPFLYIDIAKLRRKEEAAWRKADRLVAVSNIERHLMKRPDIEVVPNGVDTEKFAFRDYNQKPAERRVLFIGNFKWIQNRDALKFILEEVWPLVLEKMQKQNRETLLKLWVVGKELPQSFKKYQDKSIILDYGNKDDTWEIYAKAYMLLAPLRAAGGTSYKVLEAMASGTAVVTTSLGIEGLEAKNGMHMLSSEAPLELAEFVYNLYSDHSLYRKLTLSARKFVEENYDWRRIAKKLNEVYESTL